MKKKLLAVVLLLLATSMLSAQISLNQSSYPALLTGTDSLRKISYNSLLPSIAPAVDATWDLTLVTDSTPVFYKYRVAAPPYQFADSNNYTFSSYAYKGNVKSSISSVGFLQYGSHINYSSFTFSTLTDTIFIIDQDPVYSSPRTVVSFPAMFNSAWNCEYTNDFNYEITYVPAFSHAPGTVRTFYSEKDTVTGWGKMRVKKADGSPSGFMQVLQVRSTVMATDSFYLNGVSNDPLLPVLLSSLGLQQGKTDTTYQINYYREGEVTPLASVDIKDAAFTQLSGLTYHQQRLPEELSVAGIQARMPPVIFPNPVSGNRINIQLPSCIGAWSYDLWCISGGIVASGAVTANGSSGQVILPEGIAAGTYCIRLKHEGTLAHTEVIDIIR